ncbi:MAG: hypothetical protein CM1200mP29_11130 [Verrucomicrobiota bacterium]|nr:MAG: hypothetical protein CM1200mP29_11130 [Verrucomicrobiota bacterium]
MNRTSDKTVNGWLPVLAFKRSFFFSSDARVSCAAVTQTWLPRMTGDDQPARATRYATRHFLPRSTRPAAWRRRLALATRAAPLGPIGVDLIQCPSELATTTNTIPDFMKNLPSGGFVYGVVYRLRRRATFLRRFTKCMLLVLLARMAGCL